MTLRLISRWQNSAGERVRIALNLWHAIAAVVPLQFSRPSIVLGPID